VLSELKKLTSAATGKALRATAELVRLSRGFATQGIPLLPLKGVMLSLQLYGDPAMRHSGDLDLMVRTEDVDRACDTLESLGYTSALPLAKLPARTKALLRSHSYECAYWHQGLSLFVDIHWSQELWTAAQTSELWNRCRSKEWRGVTLRQLDDDALLLFLCDHAAKHEWSRIKWLSDVAMLLAIPRGSDWGGDLWKLAARWDLERPLAEGALLVHWLYGIEIPAPLQNLIRGDCASVKRAGEALEAILNQPEPLVSGKRPGIFQNLRSAMQRRRALSWRQHLRRLAIQAEDLEQFPLPDGFVWLYYPLRPLFWWRRRYCGRT
jgi:hypothetical protein